MNSPVASCRQECLGSRVGRGRPGLGGAVDPPEEGWGPAHQLRGRLLLIPSCGVCPELNQPVAPEALAAEVRQTVKSPRGPSHCGGGGVGNGSFLGTHNSSTFAPAPPCDPPHFLFHLPTLVLALAALSCPVLTPTTKGGEPSATLVFFSWLLHAL